MYVYQIAILENETVESTKLSNSVSVVLAPQECMNDIKGDDYANDNDYSGGHGGDVMAIMIYAGAYGLRRLDKLSRSVSEILLLDSDLESAVAEAATRSANWMTGLGSEGCEGNGESPASNAKLQCGSVLDYSLHR